MLIYKAEARKSPTTGKYNVYIFGKNKVKETGPMLMPWMMILEQIRKCWEVEELKADWPGYEGGKYFINFLKDGLNGQYTDEELMRKYKIPTNYGQ